jgi:hypothetical protein
MSKKEPRCAREKIARAINASPNQVHAVIAKLRRDKLIRERGNGYGLAGGRKASNPSKGRSSSRSSKKATSSKPRQKAAKT